MHANTEHIFLEKVHNALLNISEGKEKTFLAPFYVARLATESIAIFIARNVRVQYIIYCSTWCLIKMIPSSTSTQYLKAHSFTSVYIHEIYNVNLAI